MERLAKLGAGVRDGGPLPVALLVFVVWGVVALLPDLSGVWQAVLIGLFAAFVVSRWFVPGKLSGWIALVLGALIVPLFALLGFDAVLRAGDKHPHLSAKASVVLGIGLLAVLFFVYLAPWWSRRRAHPLVIWSLALAAALVLIPPLGFWAYGKIRGHEQKDEPTPVSHLDVIVLSEGSPPQLAPGRDGWKIETWSAHVEGGRIRWTDSKQPTQVESSTADRVLLLAVDGDKPGGPPGASTGGTKHEISTWLARADEVSAPGTATYALLSNPTAGRRTAWEQALDPADPAARHGAVFDLDHPRGARDLTDVALMVSVADPAAEQNLALAARYRPALLFDAAERYATPLNVNEVITHGLFRQCFRGGQGVPGLCRTFSDPSEIDSAAKNFAFSPDELVTLGEQEAEDPHADRTTIYVHVSRAGNDDLNAVYLDYWWYLPDNPAGAGGGGLCGPGFVIPDKTCFDHQSDWEGVTVVLDADAAPDARPIAVGYAEHDGVTRYSWSALRRLWVRDSDAARFGKEIDLDHRPLVFIAHGTHAAYPRSCVSARDRYCRAGGVPGVQFNGALEDKRHNGGKPWRGNDERNCRTLCLLPLPTRQQGSEPALWNGFAGVWGRSNCALGVVFCSSSQPPHSPGAQARYKSPWCRDQEIDITGDRFVARGGRCDGLVPSPDQIRDHQRLVALGDSYSSGEGAGAYDASTNERHNTCHRSKWAWPNRLAVRLRLVALPSRACSGAVTGDVTDGRHGGGEPERTFSQIDRIPPTANVITLTIGGNDVNFKDVLVNCVFHNCVRTYHRPDGDVLDARIDALRKRLPAVYRAIRAKAPDARLVVSGYPRLFAADPGPLPAGNCAAGRQISELEARYLNEKTVGLDQAIADAADEAGADFVDVYDAFDGHELRCPKPQYLNPVRASIENLVESFHPTKAGYERLSAVVARALLATPEQAPGNLPG